MPKSKPIADVWNEIFDDLILTNEPPIKYIKEAIIVTKNGSKFKVTADEFADISAKDKLLGYENSNIYSFSLCLDFAKIKRDVNKWSNKFLKTIETELENLNKDRD